MFYAVSFMKQFVCLKTSGNLDSSLVTNVRHILRNMDTIITLHQMHEIQSILTDVRGVCLSVMRLISASLYKNSWTDQDAVWGEHSRGTIEHC